MGFIQSKTVDLFSDDGIYEQLLGEVSWTKVLCDVFWQLLRMLIDLLIMSAPFVQTQSMFMQIRGWKKEFLFGAAESHVEAFSLWRFEPINVPDQVSVCVQDVCERNGLQRENETWEVKKTSVPYLNEFYLIRSHFFLSNYFTHGETLWIHKQTHKQAEKDWCIMNKSSGYWNSILTLHCLEALEGACDRSILMSEQLTGRQVLKQVLIFGT